MGSERGSARWVLSQKASEPASKVIVIIISIFDIIADIIITRASIGNGHLGSARDWWVRLDGFCIQAVWGVLDEALQLAYCWPQTKLCLLQNERMFCHPYSQTWSYFRSNATTITVPLNIIMTMTYLVKCDSRGMPSSLPRKSSPFWLTLSATEVGIRHHLRGQMMILFMHAWKGRRFEATRICCCVLLRREKPYFQIQKWFYLVSCHYPRVPPTLGEVCSHL